MRELRIKNGRSLRWGLAVAAGLMCLSLWPIRAPQAQRGETPVNVTGVTTQKKGTDAVVSIAGDGALTRAQTWQDDEGFHVVVYKGQNALRTGLPRGVKARRVGDSLELVVPVKSGAGVYVQPHNNQLDVVVGGGLGQATDDNEGGRQLAHSATSQTAAHEQPAARRQSVPASEQSGEARKQRAPAESSAQLVNVQPAQAARLSTQTAQPNAQTNAQN